MQNLWGFLFRNRAFFWFLAFEFMSFVLIFKYNPYQGGLYINTSNRIIGGIYEKKSEIQSYLNLRFTNQAIAEENSQLRKQLETSHYQVVPIKNKVKDGEFNQEYTYTVAKVINNTTINRNNYLTLNQGKLAGIVPGSGVIFSKGIIGVVKDVSNHFCTVLSILHEDSRISVRIRHTKNIGSMVWDGFNSQLLTVKDIPNYVDIKKGDTIETSGFSLFPEGIPIGTVTNGVSRNGASSITLQIRLFADLNSLDQVYIVNDKLSSEKIQLESTSEK